MVFYSCGFSYLIVKNRFDLYTMISHKKCSHDWGVMTTNFLGKFGEIVFILRNAFIYRGLRKFLGDCYTLSPNIKQSDNAKQPISGNEMAFSYSNF